MRPEATFHRHDPRGPTAAQPEQQVEVMDQAFKHGMGPIGDGAEPGRAEVALDADRHQLTKMTSGQFLL